MGSKERGARRRKLGGCVREETGWRARVWWGSLQNAIWSEEPNQGDGKGGEEQERKTPREEGRRKINGGSGSLLESLLGIHD